jgi:hypothetical protein
LQHWNYELSEEFILLYIPKCILDVQQMFKKEWLKINEEGREGRRKWLNQLSELWMARGLGG